MAFKYHTRYIQKQGWFLPLNIAPSEIYTAFGENLKPINTDSPTVFNIYNSYTRIYLYRIAWGKIIYNIQLLRLGLAIQWLSLDICNIHGSNSGWNVEDEKKPNFCAFKYLNIHDKD